MLAQLRGYIEPEEGGWVTTDCCSVIDSCADDIAAAAGMDDHSEFYEWLCDGARDGRQLRELIQREERI